MKMKKIITLTTDFGDQFAIAQLHAVLASLNFGGKIVDNHGVTPFSITEGAFQIAVLTKYCPINTVHIGVVDPGVGSSRRGIVLKTNKSWFVGPDNGLLFPAARTEVIQKAWHLDETKIGSHISNTFHGRDVFIKAAVYLAQRKSPETFGSVPISPTSLQTLSFENGQVLHIDHYGNVKLYWPKEIIPGKYFVVKNSNIKLELPVVKTFSDVPQGQPLALLGSNNTLELAVNLENAARLYNIHLNQTLHISYKT